MEGGPSTRSLAKRKSEAEKDAKRKKREATLFQPTKVIGPRDIPVDLGICKVKIETGEQVVKPEVEELDEGGRVIQLVDVDLEVEDNAVVVKEEVDIPVDSVPEVQDSDESETGQESSEINQLTGTRKNLELEEKTEGIPMDPVDSSCSETLAGDLSVVTSEEIQQMKETIAVNVTKLRNLEESMSRLTKRIDVHINEKQKFPVQQMDVQDQDILEEPGNGQLIQDDSREEIRRLKESIVEKNARIKNLEETATLDAIERTKTVKEMAEKDEKIKVLEGMVINLEKMLEKALGTPDGIGRKGEKLQPQFETTPDANEFDFTSDGDNYSTSELNVSLNENPSSPIQEENSEVGTVDRLDTNQVLESGNQIPTGNDKVIQLFPKVAEIIWTKYKRSVLDQKDFLNSRFICTSWKQAIDAIDNGPCKTLQEKRSVSITICCVQHVQESVKKLEEEGFVQQTFLKLSTFQSCDLSPGGLTDNEKKQVQDLTTRLLKRHGHNVGKLQNSYKQNSYIDNDILRNVRHWFRALVDWLGLMHNLEELAVDIELRWHFDDTMPNLVFPTLPKLKRANLRDLPFQTIKSLLSANPQMTTSYMSLLEKPRAGNDIEDISAPNLQDFSVSISRTGFSEQCNFLLRFQAPQLHSITLSFWLCEENPSFAPLIFKVLSKFKTTLTSVHIKRITPSVLDCIPEMPFLRKLVLQYEYACLVTNHSKRILKLSMPSLEELEIRAPKRKVNDVKDYQLCRKKLVSKMWSQLPSLRKFVIYASVADNAKPFACYIRQIQN